MSVIVVSVCLPSNGKGQFFIPILEKGNAKECSNYCTIALISMVVKLRLKFSKPGFSKYVDRELPDVQAGFRKGREPEIKLPTSTGSQIKPENFRKNLSD